LSDNVVGFEPDEELVEYADDCLALEVVVDVVVEAIFCSILALKVHTGWDICSSVYSSLWRIEHGDSDSA